MTDIIADEGDCMAEKTLDLRGKDGTLVVPENDGIYFAKDGTIAILGSVTDKSAIDILSELRKDGRWRTSLVFNNGGEMPSLDIEMTSCSNDKATVRVPASGKDIVTAVRHLVRDGNFSTKFFLSREHEVPMRIAIELAVRKDTHPVQSQHTTVLAERNLGSGRAD
jgi:hypothetical protein